MQIEKLQLRVRELDEINEAHKKLNGELREEFEMFVKHLQEYLDKFTDGKRGKYPIDIHADRMDTQKIRRIEVQDSNIIGQNSIRVVLKPTKAVNYRAYHP